MKKPTIIGGVDGVGKRSLAGALSGIGEFSTVVDELAQETVQTIAEARENGCFVRLYYVAVSSAEESLSRIANRVRKGGHDIPEDAVRRRFAKRFDDLKRVLPLVDETVFFDNENGFVHVADYRNGALTLTGEYLPKWLDELKERLK